MKIKKPEMILFDYGHTILNEFGFDMLRAERAAFAHITENPDNVTPEQVFELDDELFRRSSAVRALGFEVNEVNIMRLKYDYFRLKFDVDMYELETVIWDAASEGAKMPYIDDVLRYMKENGIRSGVVSNIGWSGHSLIKRVNRLIPENEFEFIMASSDYVLRKPDSLLFKAALNKAGLTADKVIFCGDTIAPDIAGAHEAGIFPVFYDCPTDRDSEQFARRNDGLDIPFEHLRITDWRELIDMLENQN